MAFTALGLPLAASFVTRFFRPPLPDPLGMAADLAGLPAPPFMLLLAIAGAIVTADNRFSARRDSYRDELYEILKEVGEAMSSGLAIESALHQAARWKKTGPSAEFREALELAQQAPLEDALRTVALHTSHPPFKEVAGLMSVAISAGGDVGSSLRWLGAHYSTLRATEKEFVSKLSSTLTIMRAIGLLAAPFLYAWLEHSFAGFIHTRGGPASLKAGAIAFFAFGAVGMACLDGLVFGRWSHVPAKVPLYLGLVCLMLGLS